MSSLAFKFEEIAPRELRPEAYELDGISRASIEAHYKLYQGYVNKRNEVLGKLAGGRDEGERLPGTIATNVLALERGASVFRVHDVAQNVDALAVAAATVRSDVGERS